MGYHKALAGMGWITLCPPGTNQTAIDLALATSLTLDIKEEDVPLEGPDLDLIDSYPKSRKVTGKIDVSEFSAKLLSAVTNGVTVSTGSKVGYTHSAPIPTTPFTVTVPQSANFDATMIPTVVDLTAGKGMKVVASAPATGEFSYAAGVFTFAAADTGHSVLIRYRATATTGVTAKIASAVAGAAAPKFGIFMSNGTAGILSGIYIPAARIPGLSVAFKKDGWSATSLDYTALRSATDELIYTYSPE